ncbi:YbaB/EbfC family nucleoid-associated protein [Saccharothrix obliqua]|uniref:YbaB/EbfC family nucleoid-associated protein n=1 Tax=Saccharothrix obliqua TaxID=2861747 RepID=UPI001C5FC34C|nr:YbaB/EbfC family nucleoid-associated protein [Saccharothrix obliqua]MBW4721997.1 YbaB/EbfC family nucleoid-associated protein [Saccharothrix obliqua]
MDGNILDPDGARERLAAWKGRIDKLASDTSAMGERLQAIRVTVGDPSGLVEVTVDSTGSLVDLRLSERMQRSAPDLVSRTIMATLRDAKAKVADQSQEIIAETVGAESAVGRAITDNVGRHLRGAPAPERRAASMDDDEGFDARSYLREK